MSSTQVSSEGTTEIPAVATVDMKLEVVLVPVSDGNGWLLQEIKTRLPGR